MPDDDELYEAIVLADENDQIGYTRHLCELYLRDHPDDVPTLIRYASNLILLAQYSAAQAVLDHVQTIVPEKYLQLVLAQRGRLSEARGDFSRAEKWFMQAHELVPSDATYLIYAGSVSFRSGDLNRAQAYARRATECPAGCIDEAFFNLGGYLLSLRQYREAAECYRKALEIDPDYEIAKERLSDVELILLHEGKGLS